MKIGFRTIKTALGAGISIWLAQFFQLDFPVSAAIITILCIEKTKKKSLHASLNRFLACCISLLLCGVFFEFFGYTPIVFSLFILFLIPLLVYLKIQKGFVTSVVISLHILSLESINLDIIKNEFFIISIGIIVAMLLNAYMPDHEKVLINLKDDIEKKFKKILFEYANFLESDNQSWDGKEILELQPLIEKAKSFSLLLSENHILKDKTGYFSYFHMRERQYEILERMLPVISALSKDVPQRHMFASFLFELSENVKTRNTAHIFLDKLTSERTKMKDLPLPNTREEFETRASLIYLMNEMEYYLKVKMKFFQQDADKLKLIKN